MRCYDNQHTTRMRRVPGPGTQDPGMGGMAPRYPPVTGVVVGVALDEPTWGAQSSPRVGDVPLPCGQGDGVWCVVRGVGIDGPR